MIKKRIVISSMGTCLLLFCLFFGPLGLSHASKVQVPGENTEVQTQVVSADKRNAPVKAQEAKVQENDTEQGMSLDTHNAGPKTAADTKEQTTENGMVTTEDSKAGDSLLDPEDIDRTVEDSEKDSEEYPGEDIEKDAEKDPEVDSAEKDAQSTTEQEITGQDTTKQDVTEADTTEQSATEQEPAEDVTNPSSEMYVKYYNDRARFFEQLFPNTSDFGNRCFRDEVTIDLYVRDEVDDRGQGGSGIDQVKASFLESEGSLITASFHAVLGEPFLFRGHTYQVFRTTVHGPVRQGVLSIQSITDHAGNCLENPSGQPLVISKTKIEVDTDWPEIRSNVEELLQDSALCSGDDRIYLSKDFLSPIYEIMEANYGKGGEEHASYELWQDSSLIYEEEVPVGSSIQSLENWSNQKFVPGREGGLKGEPGQELKYHSKLLYVDPVGHSNLFEQTVIIDQKAPMIRQTELEVPLGAVTKDEDGDSRVDRIYLENQEGHSTIDLHFLVEDAYLGDEVKLEVKARNLLSEQTVEGKCSVSTVGIPRACRATLTFEQDGIWSIQILVSDLAGNQTEQTLDTLVVSDFTSPVFQVKYDTDEIHFADAYNSPISEAETDSASRYYMKSALTAHIRIQDPVYLMGQLEDQLAYYKECFSLQVERLEEEDWVTSAEEAVQWKMVEDGSAIEAIVTLSEEGEYRFTVEGSDYANNVLSPDSSDEEAMREGCWKEEGSYHSPTLVLDLTDPQIEIHIMETPASVRDEISYYRQPITVEVMVKERYFCPQLCKLHLASYQYLMGEKNQRTKEKEETIIGDTLSWVEGEELGQYNTTMVLDQENIYQLDVSLEDLAMRKAKPSGFKVAIDETPPMVWISGVEGTEESDILFGENKSMTHLLDFVNYKNYAYFGKKKGYAMIYAHDAIGGVCEICYELYDQHKRLLKKDVIETSGYGKSMGLISLGEDFKGSIKAYAKDRSGLSGSLQSPRGVVTESKTQHNSHSRIRIETLTKPSGRQNGKLYYKTPVSMNLEILDSHSGIQSYYYKAGNEISGGRNYRDLYGTSDIPDQAGGNAYHFSKRITLSSAANYSNVQNPTKVSLFYRDNAGYEESDSVDIVMDHVAPKIQVSWTCQAEVKNGRYYNKPRYAHITVVERNFYEAGVAWSIQGDGVKRSAWKRDGETYACDVEFTKDGEYNLNFRITDCAGNSAEYKGESFVVDQTPPKLSLSFEEEGTHGDFYNHSPNLMLHVTEHNFRAEDVRYQITLEGTDKLRSYQVGGWHSKEDQHVVALTFQKDGRYLVTCDYTDLAGNKGEAPKSIHFHLDATEPEVFISGVKDGHAYNDVVMPKIEYQDDNLDPDSVEISIVGNKHGAISLDTYPLDVNQMYGEGGILAWKDWKRKEDVDDIYTCTVMVKDYAGNETTEQVTFSVNRFGSNYELEDRTQELLADFYISRLSDLTIYEVNVDQVVEHTLVVVNQKNELRELVEGKDYIRIEHAKKNGWRKYSYIIESATFSEEGYYQLEFRSTDKAGNLMTNALKDFKVEFYLDDTPPTIAVTGLEHSVYQDKNHKVILSPVDNGCVAGLEVYSNGALVQSFSGEECQKPDEPLVFFIKEDSHEKDIHLVACDMAGNRTDADPQIDQNYHYHVLVNNSWMVRILHFFIDIFL